VEELSASGRNPQPPISTFHQAIKFKAPSAIKHELIIVDDGGQIVPAGPVTTPLVNARHDQ